MTPGSITASTSAVTFNGTTVTRTVGSFVTDGFTAGMSIHIAGGTPYDGDYLIASVTATALTLTTSTGATNSARTGVTITGLYLARIFGHTDVDTIQLGDATGVAGGTTLGSAGYIHLGGKTRIYGSQSATVAGPTARTASSSTTCSR